MEKKSNYLIVLILVLGLCIMIVPSKNDLNFIQTQVLYDHGTYSSAEQYMLELHNRARENPEAEALRLSIDLQDGVPVNLTPQPPLAMHKILCQTATAYSEVMFNYSTLGHSVDGTSFTERLIANNYTGLPRGESVASYFSNVDFLYSALMQDSGWESFGQPLHREFILGIPINSNEFGIGNYNGGYCDLLYGLSNIAYLLGVVYNDTNANGFYNIGEGLEDVIITPSQGDFFTITGPSGGYSIPITVNGSITLTVTGKYFEIPVTKYINVSSDGDNIKIDFLAGELSEICTTSGISSETQTSNTISSTTDQEENLTTWLTYTTWITYVTTIIASKETADFISLVLLSLTLVILVVRRKNR
ncbi:MAG: CAP domain-containing protein [Candidatus Heimdallarchaeota archaeon]|nr:CAP domain-containing protein [Candidatus Heimdallarchaeota archaeon]